MKKKLVEYKLLIIAILLLLCPVVWAGIQAEVGVYEWDSVNSKWTKKAAGVGGTTTVAGIVTPVDTYANPTLGSLPALSLLSGWNGTTWDRVKTTTAGDNITVGLLANGNYVWNGAQPAWTRMVTAKGDNSSFSGTGMPAVGMYVRMGTSDWRSWIGAYDDNIASSLGLPAMGLYGYDGSTWDRLLTNTGGGLVVTGNSADSDLIGAPDSVNTKAFNYVYNQSANNWGQQRDVGIGDNVTRSIPAMGVYGYDGTNWDRAKIDTNGSLYVNPGALSSTTDSVEVKQATASNLLVTAYPPDPSYSHISTNTSTQVKSAAGYLMGISINTAGASANTITLYDNTSCATTVIGVIDGTVIGNVDLHGLKFATGLCITTATGTAPDLTVVYK